MEAVGDEYLVARVIVLGNRPPPRNAVLLVAEEILDAEQEAVLLILQRGDPPRLALADDVGQVKKVEERGLLVIRARHPEVALVAPGPRVQLSCLGHQVIRGPEAPGGGAEADVANAREEGAVPADRLRAQIEPERQRMNLGGPLGREGPGPGGVVQ